MQIIKITSGSLFALLLSVVTVLASSPSHAQYSASVPNLFNDNPSLTVPHMVLGRSCFSLQASKMDLNCNPAFMANEQKQQLRVNIIGNDRIRKMNDYRVMIDDKNEVGVADDLLAQRTPIVAKGAASAWYQNEWWAIGYVPIRTGVAYSVANPTFPRISVLGFRESEFFGKVGLLSSSNKRFAVGLQARYVKRDYIYQQFDAFEAFDNNNIIAINQHNILFLEPGFTYSWESSWNPTLAWSINNVALVHTGDPVYSEPLYDVGLSSNVGGWQDLRSAIHMTAGSRYKTFLHRFSWANTLNFDDVASTYLTMGMDQFALGFQGHFTLFTTGIGYKNEQISTNRWTSYNVSTYLFELGLVF